MRPVSEGNVLGLRRNPSRAFGKTCLLVMGGFLVGDFFLEAGCVVVLGERVGANQDLNNCGSVK